MDYKRVLIVSHNALSDSKNNGKTLTSFFRGWPREKLAQFYLYGEDPSYSICDNFFRITEFEIFLANIRGSFAEGRIYNTDAPNPIPPAIVNEKEKTFLHGIFRSLVARRRLPVAETFRNIFWRKSKYISPMFLSWMDSFSPEVVFFLGSSQPFFYKMALWICERYNASLVLHLTDDYTFLPVSFSPFAWINSYRYKEAFKYALSYAQKIFVICPAMKEEYERLYTDKELIVAANYVPVDFFCEETVSPPPLKFLYAGNILHGRWKILCLLAQCLEELREEGFHAVMDIYTPTKISDRLKNRINRLPTCEHRGILTPTQLNHVRKESHVLVHVESFKKRDRKTTRLSLSTKIPEYMASGRCILAIGPDDVGSMQYLSQTMSAVIINNKNKEFIKQTVKDNLFNDIKRHQFARKAYEHVGEFNNPIETLLEL